MTDSTERQAFLEMVDAHGRVVMAMLRRLCGNGHDAEDVFQETAVRVWRSFSTRPRLRTPRAWLMTIAYRAFVDHRRPRRNHEPLSDPMDARAANPAQQTEQVDAIRRMNAAVEELPETSRQVVILHYTGCLSIRQAADALGVSEGTVKSRLNAALVKLRSVLE